MLCAQTIEGKIVCLPPYTRTEIKEIRDSRDFFCPSCNEKLIIKIGTEITPHFSHRVASTCIGGGEGEIHEKGKWLLFSWLKNQYENVELESYIQEIHQRPDILLTTEIKKYAVEFQYSPVSTREIRKRNKMYKSIEIKPIWFLDIKHLQHRSNTTFILNSFVKQFLFKPANHPSPVVIFFCSEKEQITILQNIVFTSLTKVLGQKVVYSLQSTNWHEVLRNRSFSIKFYLKSWSQEKKRFRMQQRNAVGKQREWLIWLYERQLPIDYLPSVIYLPVKGQMLMNVQPWNWQSRLWYYLQYKVGQKQNFTRNDCLNYLSSFIYPPQYYPLLKNTTSPIDSFLTWLSILGYVEQKEDETYVLCQPIHPHAHIEEALQQDTLLMTHIEKIYKIQ